MTHQTVWILDFGSQYTQLIARRVREEGVYCQIMPCTYRAPERFPEELVGLILSGGPASVLGEDAPAFDERWFEVERPILGVCYGMQLMTHSQGGKVGRGASREYGSAFIELSDKPCPLFEDFSPNEAHKVWMSHGDHVASPPPGFNVSARSSKGVIAAMANEEKQWYGLQFHPEVTHSVGGEKILRRFIRDVCHAEGDWSAGAFINEQIEKIRSQVGDDKVICGLSGGVDFPSLRRSCIARLAIDSIACLWTTDCFALAKSRLFEMSLPTIN